VLLITVAVALAIDLGSKYWAFNTLGPTPVEIDKSVVQAKMDAGVPLNHIEPIDQLSLVGAPPEVWRPILPRHDPTVIVPYGLEFKLILNAGAVFGSGHGKRWLFVAFTGVAVLFCLYLFAHWTKRGEWLTHTAIALVLAGGLGNLYDRLVYACVRDFLHPLPNVRWPFGWEVFGNREVWPYVSNVADAFLLVGIGVIMIKLWRTPHPEPRRTPGELSSDAAHRDNDEGSAAGSAPPNA
jgi:signal peptidase II